MKNFIFEYDHYSFLHFKQPIGLGNSAVNTAKPDKLPQPPKMYFNDIKKIIFIYFAPPYEVPTNTIS